MESEGENKISSDITVDRGEEYETLHLAAAYGSTPECKRFVKDVGIDVNAPDAQVPRRVLYSLFLCSKRNQGRNLM